MIREILEGLDYEAWKAKAQELDDKVSEIEKVLKKFPTGDHGLVPDDIRKSVNYKKVKSEFDRAFKELQDFNRKSSKAYKRRASRERRGV
jgi:viroplasmin and RNaseH domain-containing protein